MSLSFIKSPHCLLGELSFCTVFHTTSLEDCLQRNRTRASPVPESVIREQFSKLELPDSDENSWETFSLVKPAPTVEVSF